MEPLKNSKNLLRVLPADSNSIILYGKLPVRHLLPCRNPDTQRFIAPVLDGVTDQILEHLLQMDIPDLHKS